jgi:hypothetical protein
MIFPPVASADVDAPVWADGSTAVIDRRTRRTVTPTADRTPAIRRIAHGPSQNEVEGRMN